MKTAISFNTVNQNTSGPGAFLRAAKWYWDEVTDMAAAAGFTSVMTSMVPNTENVARNGAPICTASIRTRYGSPEGYRSYLNEKGIDRVAAMSVSAQNLVEAMNEKAIPFSRYFEEFFLYAEDVADMLQGTGGDQLLISPTPGMFTLNQLLGQDEAKWTDFQENTVSCLNRIGAMCREKGIYASIKNDFWTAYRGDRIRALMEKLDSTVSFAPDTAMLRIAGADYRQLIEEYASSIHCICFTDTKFTDQVHAFESASPEYPQTGPFQRCYNDLGYGEIDFAAVYQTLANHGFDGLVILESRYALDIPKAILRTRTFWNKLTGNTKERR